MSRKVRQIDPENLEINDLKIRTFLDAQKPKTAKTYTSFFRTVLRLTSCSGSSMLENSKLWNKKLFEIRNKMIEEKYSVGTIHACLGAVRGFFTFYDVNLHLNKQQLRQLNEKARNSSDYLFSVNDLRRMYAISNLKEKYVLTNSGLGLRSEDFVRLSYGQYRQALERMDRDKEDPPVFLCVMDTGKEHVPATLFLNSDAIPIIRAILDSHKDAKDSDLVWTEREVQLTEVLKNIVRKAGIDPHEDRVRFHSLRKYLFSALSKNVNQEYAKMLIGKKIQEGAYLDPKALREIYQKAMMDIVVIRNGTSPETTNKLLALEEENRELREKVKRLEGTSTSRDAENKTRIDELYAMVKELKEAKK